MMNTLKYLLPLVQDCQVQLYFTNIIAFIYY